MPHASDRKDALALDRRDFLRGGAAALVVPFAVSFSSRADAAAGPTQLGAYLKIDANNIVTVVIGSTEMGQGIMTGLSQLVAEELMLSWSQVRAEHALASSANPNPFANPAFNMQLTGGSTTIRGWYTPLRTAAAIARQMLLTAASQLYGGTWQLKAGGQVTNGATSYPFSALVAKAATLTPPASATLATTANVIGKRMPRLDIPPKVNGSAVFGIDVRVPGMVYASVVHCPTLGGTIASMPTSAAGALALVNLGNAVGVVATDTWTAMKVAKSVASQVSWTLPTNLASRNSADISAAGKTLAASATVTPKVYEATGASDPATVIAAATKKIDATYDQSFLAHGCMEVLNCTAVVTPTSCEVWAPTQGQQFTIPTIQQITGLTPAQIIVHTTFLGGGFGRKIGQDYVAQAVTIAKKIGKPVKLTWSREQDFKNDLYRPCSTIRVQAALDANNNVTALLYRNVSPSITAQQGNPEDTGAVAGAVGLPYAIANRRVEFVANPSDIPLGYWRSVGESYNIFAVESAIDELAVVAGKDPLAFRKSLLVGDSRAWGVVNAVDKLSGWSTTTPPTGSKRGVAFMKGFGSYIALVAEASLVSGKLKVNKMFCAIDCGVVINPDSVEAQMQGGIAHGLSAALWGQVTFANGVPNVNNFSNYRVLKLSEMPTVSVSIVASTAAPGGVGETGVPCVAPAIANAYAKLSGVRQRSLPFYPGSTMGEL